MILLLLMYVDGDVFEEGFHYPTSGHALTVTNTNDQSVLFVYLLFSFFPPQEPSM